MWAAPFLISRDGAVFMSALGCSVLFYLPGDVLLLDAGPSEAVLQPFQLIFAKFLVVGKVYLILAYEI